MAYETTLSPQQLDAAYRPARAHFLRSERLIFLLGASGFGSLAGFAMALALGRQDLWTQLLAAAPVLALALYFASATYVEAQERGASGCRLMAAIHGAALIAWPLFMPLQGALHWLAPAVALTSILLLGACWRGSSGAIYRSAAQAALAAALSAYQGVVIVLG